MRSNGITLVTDYLERWASESPERSALVAANGTANFGELNSWACAIAQLLRELGLRTGDRCIVNLPNSAAAVAVFFGVLKARGVAVLINPGWAPGSISEVASDCAAVLEVGEGKQGRELRNEIFVMQVRPAVAPRGAKSRVEVSLGDLAQISRLYDFEPAVDTDAAFLVYTSASTGRRKGVICPHLNVAGAVDAINTYLKIELHDVICNVMPLSFDHGLYQVLTAWAVGASVLLERDFSQPYAVIQRAQRAGVTGFPGVPSLFALLLRMGVTGKDLPNLRYLSSTGGIWPQNQISELMKRFPSALLYSMYGLTECKRVSYLPPADILRKSGSIGKGMPNQDLWIENTHGHKLGPNEVGELVVRGRNVMQGYWGNPEESKAVFQIHPQTGERHLHTGDLMCMDEDGYLFYHGRIDDLVKVRGIRVHPAEVERPLRECPGVSDVAVVAVPYGDEGYLLAAFATLIEPCTGSHDEILAHCRAHLDAHLVPRLVTVLPTLPLGPNGKVDRATLVDLANRRLRELACWVEPRDQPNSPP